MAREGFFYLDDPPQQGRRYVPIPAQGQSPPNTYPANTLNTILASWPTGMEYAPYQRPLNIAPLTLTYGSQPPPYSTANLNNTLTAWVPPDPQPTQRPLNIVPLTFTYGNPPTPTNPALFNSIIGTWIPPDPLPTQRPPTAPIPAQGSQPPPFRQRQPDFTFYADFTPVETVESVAAILPSIVTQTPFIPYPIATIQSWQVDSLPVQRPTTSPITAQGQQPPPYSFVNAYSIVNLWQPPDPLPVQRPPFAVIPPPIVNNPPTAQPFPWAIIFSWTNGLEYYAPQRPPSFPFPTPIPTGHGKTAGVPNIGHQGATSDAIRRWLRKAREKQAKRQAAADKRQSDLAARYEATAALPTRTRLRARTTIGTDHSSPVVFYTPPTPYAASSLVEIAVTHSFPVALLEPSLHNMHSETTIAVSHDSRVAFKDMARVHAQDQAMLSAILARLMLED